MRELHIVDFLRNGGTLEQLQSNPYNLIVKEQGNLVLLKYNQLTSDFSEPIVRECRGIILSRSLNWKPVCVPFFKFFNWHEANADVLSGNLRVYQKIDGSLAKVWYDHEERKWMLSSNGNIDAIGLKINGGKTFDWLFNTALANYDMTFAEFTAYLNKDVTYMYELATQDNPIVIHYGGYHLFYLGERHNYTYQEFYNPDPRIENVKAYNLKTLEDIERAAEQLPEDEEGYVVCDNQYRRVKIKNPVYFLMHKIANNCKPDLLDYVLRNDTEEFLSYFPQYTEEIKRIRAKMDSIRILAENYHLVFTAYMYDSKKDYAARVLKNVPKEYQSYLFKVYDDHNLSWADFTKDWPASRWEKYLTF